MGWDWLLGKSRQWEGRKWWRTKSVLGCIFMYLETIAGSEPHEQSIKPKHSLMLSFQVAGLFCWVVQWELDEKQNSHGIRLHRGCDYILNYSFIGSFELFSFYVFFFFLCNKLPYSVKQVASFLVQVIVCASLNIKLFYSKCLQRSN